MFGGNGIRRAGPENDRLRAESQLQEGRITWYRNRLSFIAEQMRTWRARAEIAEGRLAASEQLVQRQLEQLMERDSRLARQATQLQATGDDTVETPIPAELAAA